MDVQLILKKELMQSLQKVVNPCKWKDGLEGLVEKVDALSNRKERSNPSFDEDSVRELNHYFSNLCHDEDYIRPVPMDITENIPAPKLTLSQVS